MALTIKTNFTNYLPVYNPVELCVDSDNTAETNFKYVFRVYVEGETFGGVGYKQYEAVPEPSLDYGVLDAHNLIQTFVEADMGQYNSTSAFSYAANSIKKYNVEIYEMWDVAGVPTLNPDAEQGQPLDTGDFYTFEGSLDYHSWIDWNSTDYLLNSSTGVDAQFLTDNKGGKVSINDLGWTYYMTDEPTNCNYIEIKTYDSTGTIIDTFRASNTLTLSTTSARLCKFASSPQSLNNIGGSLLLGTQPIITSSVSSYTIDLHKTDTTLMSELLTFTIEEPCRYTEYRLHFENRFGGFDSFSFGGRNTRTTSMQRTSYKSSAYPIVSAGIDRKQEDKSNITNWTKRTNNIKLISDYLTDAENTWLEQLLYSNEIYLEFVDGAGVRNFKSVHKVVGTSWVEKETAHDKLFKLEIEIELGHEAYSQRK